MTSDHDIPADIRRACSDLDSRPSSFDPALANALALIVRLEALVPRLERSVAVLEAIAGVKSCRCSEPRPVAVAVGFMCTCCGGNCSPAGDRS